MSELLHSFVDDITVLLNLWRVNPLSQSGNSTYVVQPPYTVRVCILFTHSTYVFRFILTINSNCFRKQHCNVQEVCFLCGRNWIFYRRSKRGSFIAHKACIHRDIPRATALRRAIKETHGVFWQRSLRRPGPVHVRFQMEGVALGQVFLRALRLSPVGSFPPVLHIILIILLLSGQVGEAWDG